MGVQHSAERNGSCKAERPKNAVSGRSIDRRSNVRAGLSLRGSGDECRRGIARRDLHEFSQRSQPPHYLSTQQDDLRLSDIAHFAPPSGAYRASNGADSGHAADFRSGWSTRPASARSSRRATTSPRTRSDSASGKLGTVSEASDSLFTFGRREVLDGRMRCTTPGGLQTPCRLEKGRNSFAPKALALLSSIFPLKRRGALATLVAATNTPLNTFRFLEPIGHHASVFTATRLL